MYERMNSMKNSYFLVLYLGLVGNAVQTVFHQIFLKKNMLKIIIFLYFKIVLIY